MQCKETNKNGEPCKAPATESGSGLCYFHEDPSRAADIGRQGGLKNRHYHPVEPIEVPPLETAEQVRQFLAQVATDLRMHRIEPKTASTLGYVCQSLLRSIEVAELEKRLEALEVNNK